MSRAVLISKVSAFIPPSLPFVLGSDKLERCWRRHVQNPPVTDLWLWISATGNDEALFLERVPPTCTDTWAAHGQQTGSTGPGEAQSSSPCCYLHSFWAFKKKKNLGSGLSSSMRSTPRSTAGTSGSDQNIWVLLGTLRFRLSQHSQPLGWNFFEARRYRLMSTTVQIPEMLLDVQNHIRASQDAAVSESRGGEFRVFALPPVRALASLKYTYITHI